MDGLDPVLHAPPIPPDLMFRRRVLLRAPDPNSQVASEPPDPPDPPDTPLSSIQASFLTSYSTSDLHLQNPDLRVLLPSLSSLASSVGVSCSPKQSFTAEVRGNLWFPHLLRQTKQSERYCFLFDCVTLVLKGLLGNLCLCLLLKDELNALVRMVNSDNHRDLEGLRILSNQIKSCYGLPCIEVLVIVLPCIEVLVLVLPRLEDFGQHVLTMCVVKGLALVVGFVIYYLAGMAWEPQPSLDPQATYLHLVTCCCVVTSSFNNLKTSLVCGMGWCLTKSRKSIVCLGSKTRMVGRMENKWLGLLLHGQEALVTNPLHNVAAAWVASSRAGGFGWVLCDNSHCIISEGYSSSLFFSSALVAETLAVKTALIAVTQAGIHDFHMFLDSLSLVTLLNIGGVVNELKNLLIDIHCLVAFFPFICFSHVSRSNIFLADPLAKSIVVLLFSSVGGD